MKIVLCVALLLCLVVIDAFRPTSLSRSITGSKTSSLKMGVGKEAKRAWTKGDLGEGADMFDDTEDDAMADVKKKFKLEPETIFFEGPPAASEVIIPALSIITVLGIIPFVSALARQAWVRYKFTSRRVSIQSGIGGKEVSEIIYPDVEEIKYVFRFGGPGDMVLFLKDGAKVEMRHVPKFEEIYEYVLAKCDTEAQQKSMQLPAKSGTGI